MFSSRWSKKLRPQGSRLQFESLEDRRVMSADGVTSSPLALEPVVQTAPTLLTTEEWVHSLNYTQFHLLTPEQIVYLLPSQVATIPNASYFGSISAASRAVLNQMQIQALNVANCRIHLLTPQQIGFLTTSQIQQVINIDFQYLYPTQIPQLTAAQIGTITTEGVFATLSDQQRAAMTMTQVRALPVGLVRITRLTPTQISWLTAAQIQTLQNFDFYMLSPTQVPLLTAQQIGSYWWAGAFDFWSTQSVAALTTAQIQAIDTSVVRLHRLSSSQINLMTTAQIQAVPLLELVYVPASRIPQLTTAQIAGLPTYQYVALWNAEQRAALTASQIRALRPEALRLNLLTSAQIGALRVAQVQVVMPEEFQYLKPAQIPYLRRAQIADMSLGAWNAMSSTLCAALTQQQVTWLNVGLLGILKLTPTQIGWLTVGQIRSLPSWQFDKLHPHQISLLKPKQVAEISTATEFNLWSNEAVAALTYDQVRLLNTTDLRINRLTSQQVSWLRVAQIRAVKDYEFNYLRAFQIPLLSLAQLAAVSNINMIRSLPDALREAFTRQQLLSLPWNILSEYIDSPANTNYHPAVHMPIGPDGIPVAAHLTTEADRFFALVPLTAVTHRTVASGDWSNPAIWQNGVVPSAGAKVLISTGTTVRFDSVMSNFAINTLRVDGALWFAVDRNTEMRADTIVVTTAGKLHIGTAANPIQNHVSAKILIAANGPINTTTDPYKLGRGLVSRGEVRMHGEYKTPYVTLAVNPAAGATQLQLSSVPTNWTVGDRIVITGHATDKTDDFGADEVTITAINGNLVTVTPLKYAHAVIAGHGLSLNVANLSRNIIFASTGNPPVQERPHMVFFHNPNVQIENIGVYGFGRTDKSVPVTDPVVVNGVLQAGTGANPRARYALHFHHTSVNPVLAPAVVRGSVVDGSPGWGFVNHSSNVTMEYNVAYRVNGASFVGEDGNEIGTMRGNLSINATGTSGGIISRRSNHDWGFGGHGFWMQGPGIKLIDNIAAGSREGAFVYFTWTEKNLFDAVNLANPNTAYGHLAVPVGMVPAAQFQGNLAYASGQGLELWHHMLETTDQNTYIDDFTVWGARQSGIALSYAGHVTIRNARLINDVNNVRGTGVFTNDFVQDVNIQNLTVIGYNVGVDAALRGATNINNAYFAAAQAVYVAKGTSDTRKVYISGDVTFATLTSTQLKGQTQYDVYATGAYNPQSFVSSQQRKLFAQDLIVVAVNGASVYRVSFNEQLSSHVPFPSSTATGVVPSEYLNKTNAQLYSLYGVSFAGEVLTMAQVTQLPRVYGLVRYGL
jgi:hypothetical protein